MSPSAAGDGGTGLDCTRCGACCAAPRRDAAGWAGPLTVDEARRLSPHVVSSPAGPLLACRPDGSGRCVHLEGVLDAAVRCAIYARRPDACRALPPGDPVCGYHRSRSWPG